MKIQGSNAFVTGGASGLGEATVRALAARGARVAIYDLPRSKGAELEKELGPADALPARRRHRRGAGRAPRSTPRSPRSARCAALVNCAGIGSASRTVGKDAEPFPLDAFRRTIEVNLIGTFNVIRLAAARMVGNEPDASGERGAIVNTASIAAFDGQIGQAAYSASKGGVVGMTLPIARDLARHGIRVCTIAPGLFKTPLLMGLPEPALEALGALDPVPAAARRARRVRAARVPHPREPDAERRDDPARRRAAHGAAVARAARAAVLVTGATGLVGRRLVASLRAAGRAGARRVARPLAEGVRPGRRARRPGTGCDLPRAALARRGRGRAPGRRADLRRPAHARAPASGSARAASTRPRRSSRSLAALPEDERPDVLRVRLGGRLLRRRAATPSSTRRRRPATASSPRSASTGSARRAPRSGSACAR